MSPYGLLGHNELTEPLLTKMTLHGAPSHIMLIIFYSVLYLHAFEISLSLQ